CQHTAATTIHVFYLLHTRPHPPRSTLFPYTTLFRSMLTMIAWFLTLFLGLLTQFDGLDISLLVESFKEFSIGGVLLFILSTPIILVTLVMKNYVPTIIFTVVITLINVMGGSSE